MYQRERLFEWLLLAVPVAAVLTVVAGMRWWQARRTLSALLVAGLAGLTLMGSLAYLMEILFTIVMWALAGE